MRIIKLRAWDEIKKEMFYQDRNTISPMWGLLHFVQDVSCYKIEDLLGKHPYHNNYEPSYYETA